MDDQIAKLNPAQAKAVLHDKGPLLVLAGPGSGKTRVITTRISYLIKVRGVYARSILALTFTNKAAGEMRERVLRETGANIPVVGTFHSFGASFLRREADAAGISSNFSIYNQSDSRNLIKKICKEQGIDKDSISPQQIQNAISDAKNRALTPEQYQTQALSWQDETTGLIYELYTKRLTENAALDFDDLLLKSVHTLRSNNELRENYQTRFEYLLVDEYQDTNQIQYELTKLLGGGHQNICVTGDPDQSIYSWRGADITNILNFEKDFPETTIVVLGHNYRSTKTIVKAADALVRYNHERKHKDLFTDNEEGRPIRILVTQDETHEAIKITEMIRDVIEVEGLSYKDIAIFYRTNAQSRALEQGLREAAIPYCVVGSVEFYQRKEILDLLAWLRLLINPYDEVAFLRAISNPRRGVGSGSSTKIINFARANSLDFINVLALPELLQQIRGKPKKALGPFYQLCKRLQSSLDRPIADIVAELVRDSEYESFLHKEDPLRAFDRIENVNELISDAAQYDQNHPEGDLGTYLEHIALISDVDKWDSEASAVSMLTLHAAKGLEFEAVFITGFEDGFLPHSRAIQGESGDIEEERRLLYVGITRAKQFLNLSLARHRQQFGTQLRNTPSRFLLELPRETFMLEDLSGSNAYLGYGQSSDFFKEAAQDRDTDEVPFDIPDEEDFLLADQDHEQNQMVKLQVRSAFTKEMVTSHGEPAFTRGDRVQHRVFGVGTIQNLHGRGQKKRAKIIFDNWGEKNLALEFAQLKRL